ncbi:hypothetical protein CHS0354_019972 [Potamilus streckersoni]|uniref:A-kinase anchor protein 7-like phosphoesterase domain-containing protein n=1 Tax=Potamilus streckersoni TaxID=2493646 RepID=A0AAE0VN48_9BIVA|nr:hypothetical protein CHS0354_019972 [Potamilus streckersoni]
MTHHRQEERELKRSRSTPAKTSDEIIYLQEDGDRAMEELTGAVGVQHSDEKNAESWRDFNSEIAMDKLSIYKPVPFEENHDPYYRLRTGHRNTGIKPNFFLSLDITNKSLRENATKVQKILSSSLPNYANYIEPESSLHITLALLNLKGNGEISKCSDFLKNLEPNLAELARKVPPLNLRGVGNFGEGIIYAKVEDSLRFFEFVYILKESLKNGGVCITNQNLRYTPHLTLIKCPRGMTGKASPATIAQCIHRLQDPTKRYLSSPIELA